MSDSSRCPICRTSLEGPKGRVESMDGTKYDCPVCGNYKLAPLAENMITLSLEQDEHKRPILAHFVRVRTSENKVPLFKWDMLEEVVQHGDLPTVFEQSENIIRFLGKSQRDPGKFVEIDPSIHWALVGAYSTNSVLYCIKGLVQSGLIEHRATMSGPQSVALTFAGWRRFEELMRGRSSSRTAFMAMGYGDPNVTSIVDNYFRSAVAQTGFHLSRLDDNPEAGLIDTRMVVEIKSAALLIADLTNNNSGAYWEAGFAEGLGKPVIYTCSKEHFRAQKVHFDTNHHWTVVWDPNAPEDACETLKATIRNTMPDAILED